MTEPMTMSKIKDEMRRETENVVNRLHRHCRIGRVEKKFQTLNGWVKPARSIFSEYAPRFSGGYVHPVGSGDVIINPVHGVMM